MANNTVAEMRIIKGAIYKFSLELKAEGASIPITLDPADTATLYISSNESVPELFITKEMTQGAVSEDGIFTIELTAEETALLPAKSGFREDNTFMATCRAYADTNTAELGPGSVEIPRVTIINVGL